MPKVGDLFTHTKRPEWGRGVVVEVTSKGVDLSWENNTRTTIASKFLHNLDAVDPASLPAESPLLDASKWDTLYTPPKPPRTPTTVAGTPCAHCGVALHQSQVHEDWKSCPKCSATDGDEHVYKKRDAFGYSQKRENSKNTDGVQSHCAVCRQDADDLSETRRCSEF